MLKRNKNGFTLVELIVVIAVIGIIAAIAIVSYRGIQERARDTKRVDDLAKVVQAFQLWRGRTTADFTTMSAGSGGNEAGWFDTVYAGYPSVLGVLVSAGLLKDDIVDPINRKSGANSYAYMITPCTLVTSASHRVILARLEVPPNKPLNEQLGMTCNHSTFTGYVTTYGMNYGRMIELD